MDAGTHLMADLHKAPLNIRLTQDQLAFIDRLRGEVHESRSAVIRRLIQQAIKATPTKA